MEITHIAQGENKNFWMLFKKSPIHHLF